jgi:hypothetical protein
MGSKNSKVVKNTREINKYRFKEIIVFEVFEIKNGVLGLDRSVYLSVVKFLDSPILRSV